MNIGLGIGDIVGRPAPLDDLIAQAQQAERDGFASVWLAHIRGFDAMTAVALIGRETGRIALGTAVVPTFSRHPVAMAQQALTVQAATRGRFTLGIGLSHQVIIETVYGLSFAKSLSHMKEYLAALTPLVRTGAVNYQGKEFRTNASLSVAEAKPFPIVLAAMAPKMLALAGAEADGTVPWMTGPKTLRDYTIPTISEAAAKAGRPTPRVVVGLPVAVTADVAAARESAAREFEIYGKMPSYRAMLDREGVASPAGVAIVGDEDAVGEQLQRLGAIGVTDYVAIPFKVEKDAGILERTRAALVKFIRDRTK